MISATIGRYKIVEELGRGGMGIVYKGDDPVLGRAVAIKILPPHFVENQESRERFVREAQTGAKLNHPSIRGIYDISEHEGIFYIVLEFVSGAPLDDYMKKKKSLPVDEALEIFIPVCEALEYAHQHGIIHRDVKPANVIYSDKKEVKVADFGLAWIETEQSLTRPGAVMGTFGYFSPE